MGDDDLPLGEIQVSSESQPGKVSEGVKDEVRGSMDEHSKSVKEYVQARSEGLRDKDTLEHLPPKPEIYFGELQGQHALEGKGQPAPATDTGNEPEIDNAGVIKLDENDRIVSVTHPNGKTAEMEYDEQGNLNKVKLPDQGEWNKTDDGWVRKDKSGKVVDTVNGDIHVDDSGDIILTDNESGETYVSHLDGSHTKINADQSQITRDVNGRPISMTHPNGETAKVEYDDKGNPNKIKLPDEGEWNKTESGWVRKDKDGKVVDELNGDIMVSEDGDIALRDNGSGETQVSHLDGSRSKINADNSQLTKDADGRVVSMTHPDGKTATVEYGEDGEPNRINLPDKGHWEKKDDGTWRRYDTDNVVVDTLHGTIQVSDKGDIGMTDEKKGEMEISYLNGDYEKHTNVKTL